MCIYRSSENFTNPAAARGSLSISDNRHYRKCYRRRQASSGPLVFPNKRNRYAYRKEIGEAFATPICRRGTTRLSLHQSCSPIDRNGDQTGERVKHETTPLSSQRELLCCIRLSRSRHNTV